MKVFAISPLHSPYYLFYGFILESVLLFFTLVLYAVAGITLYKLRLNIHLKIMGAFLYTQCFLFLVARILILGYQLGFYFHGVLPENNLWIVVSSWWRGYYLLMVLTICNWISIEREISLYYIDDYEHVYRWWIPTSVIILAIILCSLCASCYTFEWVPLPLLASLLTIFAAIGVLIYEYNHRRTKILNEALKQRKPCKLKYCLSVRYQLEENTWIAAILKNALIALCLVNFFTVIAFLSIYLPYFEEETHKLMDCLFNILIAVNGPIFGFGVYFHNTYLVGLLKKFFGKEAAKTVDDEGDFYFGQLMQQWDEHFGGQGTTEI